MRGRAGWGGVRGALSDESSGVFPYVRTLRHQDPTGLDTPGLRLWRAAEFPAPLQCGADPADPGGSARRWPAQLRAAALGPDTVLGQGSARLQPADQRAGRIRAGEARLPQRHAAAALPDTGRRLL